MGGEGLANGCGKLTGGKGNFSDGAARRSPASARERPLDSRKTRHWLLELVAEAAVDTHDYNDARSVPHSCWRASYTKLLQPFCCSDEE